jgi:hypothetical protein
MNNDELQKAIDDITRDTAAPVAPAPTTAAVVENDQLADELEQQQATVAPTPEIILGTAPAPVVPEDPAMPPAVKPVEEAAAVATAEPEVVAAPAAEPVAPVTEEVAEAPIAEPETEPEVEPVAPVEDKKPISDDVTLEEALKELYPLLDKVEMPAQEKFDITMRVGEPSKALEYAKAIADDTAKANALLAIVERLK